MDQWSTLTDCIVRRTFLTFLLWDDCLFVNCMCTKENYKTIPGLEKLGDDPSVDQRIDMNLDWHLSFMHTMLSLVFSFVFIHY